MHLVTLAGCIEPDSRAQQLLDWLGEWLGHYGLPVRAIRLCELPADDLIHARGTAPAIAAALQTLAGAQALVIATPIRQGTYSGVLKTFLDLLPPGAFAGLPVLPLACGGERAQQLTLHYALKPVLDTLGAASVLSSVQIGERQARIRGDGLFVLDPAVENRLEAALVRLLADLPLAAGLPQGALPPPPRTARRVRVPFVPAG